MQERSQPELYALQQRLQAAESPHEVALCAVDQSAAALAYEQAVLWWLQPAARRLAMVGSGLAEISADSPYQQWLARLVDAITPQPFDRPGTFTLADLPETVAADGVEWFPGVLLHCPVCRPDGIAFGGMLFFRVEPFSDVERALAQSIGGATASALWSAGAMEERP
jgi:GAF domain-containing protein